MPVGKRPGKTGKYFELPDEVIAGLEAMAADFGTKFVDQLIMACRRHIAYPPARLAPLPDSPAVPPAAAPAKKPARKRPSRTGVATPGERD